MYNRRRRRTVGFTNKGYTGFDGIDDFIELAGTVDYGATVSISAWVKFLKNETYQGIISNKTGGAGHREYFAVNGDNEFRFYTDDGDDVTGSEKSVGTTYHVVITAQNGEQKLYVNKVLDASETHAMSQCELDQIGGIWGEWELEGTLDEIAIYTKILSSDEISKLYGGGTPQTCGDMTAISGLAGGWRFEEGTGIITEDVSENSNNGTLKNGVEWGTY